MALSIKMFARILAQQSGVSVGSEYTAVRKKLNMLLHKVRAMHKLLPEDHTHKVHSWQWFIKYVNLDKEDLGEWYWTDAAFHLNGYVNSKIRAYGQPTIQISYTKSFSISKRSAGGLHNLESAFEETVNSDRYMLLV